MKKFLLSALLMFAMIASAQEGTVEKKPVVKKSDLTQYLNSSKKLGFTAVDSLFQMNIGFRVQSRVGYGKEEGESGVVEGEIRRMRLKLDGFVYNPKFGYKVELGFSARDIGTVVVGNSGNVILDGVFFYKPTSDLTIGFGQTKLPGNNQRVISSNSLELTDRSINNSKFNIDRDFGLFLDYSKESPNHFSYSLKGAITKGEGRNWVKTKDDGIALTGKVELFPLGAFTKNGSNFEADLMREKTPKLMISGAFSQNNNALRAQGQLGNSLFDARTLQSLFFDAMFKYNGWSATAAYMSRMADNPITVNPLDISKRQAVFVGHGVDAQLSYLFPSNFQVIGRFSTQKVDDEIQTISPDVDEYTIGLSKYIFGHKLKVQTEFSYDNVKNYSGNVDNNWFVRFQVEIGI
ncbi:OprO/OprP family phosphate-selective porin [Flavobacterium sp. K5-23]|uniref:OprO/OprP family phosphate-selective porin n=1 Tax=Flavobacterium sp. K5-23 TaxID=2746225 RepID=UPI00200F14DB|nr:OprO/OprP family phosphate-selective porin [Flavobacterium sp. K5-23]UQD55315.1 porin [Flavobacterium sp. K5-23]